MTPNNGSNDMSDSIDALVPGDGIEVLYRVWRPADSHGQDVVERWTIATVIAREPATWPLARLADGQVTEIRPFMKWRLVLAAESRRRASAAA
jgi:hypothetical protein